MSRWNLERLTTVIVCVLAFLCSSGSGQAPVIESFSSDGELVCTGLKPGSRATIEWAPTVNGPWSDSWTNLAKVIVPADGTIRVKVPIFYRVRQEVEQAPPTGMVLIPAGPFVMGDVIGDTSDWGNERPVHIVYVSAFYMDRTEVTKALWDEVYSWAVQHGYRFDSPGFGKGPDHPVHSVSWHDCVKWCNARSEKEGRLPAYYLDCAHTRVYRTGRVPLVNDWVKWNAGYRLPTEAEWEKAARGGLEGRRFPWGDTINHWAANYFSTNQFSYDVSTTMGFHPSYAVGGEPYTSPVGSFAPNGYGLYDMAGNVWEWCWDSYYSYYYEASPLYDPRGPWPWEDALTRGLRELRWVLRGGSWNVDASECRVSNRAVGYWDMNNWYRNDEIGFRSVLPVDQ